MYVDFTAASSASTVCHTEAWLDVPKANFLLLSDPDGHNELNLK